MKRLLVVLAIGLIIAAIVLKTNSPTEQGCCADSTKIGCMDSIKAISPDSCAMKQYKEPKDTVLIDSNEFEKPKGLI